MSKYYPDISHHHPVSDWGKIKANCPFIITKATEGQSFVDGTLNTIIKKCEEKKIPYWLYAFLRKGEELEQAKFLVKTCKDRVGKYFVGYVLDIESKNSEKNCHEALNYLTKLGYKTMIYTMYSDYPKYKNLIQNRPASCAWWEARYGRNDGYYSSKYPCHSGVDLHQYTEYGRCPGINDKIDLNRLTGRKPESWFLTREIKPEKKAPYTRIKKTSGKSKIKWLQTNLNKCYTGDLPDLVVDGIWLQKTTEMLKAYWKQLGWNTSGTYAGEKTCKALYSRRKK